MENAHEGGYENGCSGSVHHGNPDVQRNHGRRKGHWQKGEMGPGELADFLAGFARGIAHRGKCQLGDRTILDAVDAGARKAQEACAEGADMGAMLRRAAEGAKEGVKATEDMLPKYGKAAVFSAKAKGVPDQGAVAGQYFLEGLGRYFL